jgi:hypothetical protein
MARAQQALFVAQLIDGPVPPAVLSEIASIIEAQRRALALVHSHCETIARLVPARGMRHWTGRANSAYLRGVDELSSAVSDADGALDSARIHLDSARRTIAAHGG